MNRNFRYRLALAKARLAVSRAELLIAEANLQGEKLRGKTTGSRRTAQLLRRYKAAISRLAFATEQFSNLLNERDELAEVPKPDSKENPDVRASHRKRRL